jgi:2-succinyl-6-hydroxy-2,4-cyclohexadiene-1-carboxylate synthase
MPYRFHYSVHGKLAQPSILFLHGFLGDGRDFDGVIAHLTDQFCCIMVDLPGHGQTRVEGGDEQYTIVSTAKALIQWLDEIGIPRCFLVGYSMGGRLALYLAIHFPQRFPKVVLESASPGLKTEQERQERLQRDFQLADQLEADFPSFLTHWYQQPLFQLLQQHPEFEQMMQRRSQNCPFEIAKSLRYLSTGRQPSLWSLLETHRQPLLLLVGGRDRKFCQINQEMAERCPTARLAIVPECGHAIHLEQPAAFANWVQTGCTMDVNQVVSTRKTPSFR